ncbi:YciI family protein [Fodinicola acaciae]|uniref:YciI family protein n=1 Tax=Fodinicola acaciae TaxID=2681555 RepID=UPI0013D29E1F|nr:YciI family protein [Fodinicola acaciae]
MKYLILIYHNPEMAKLWQSMPPERRAAGLRAYEVLNDELRASGELVATEPVSQTKVTRVTAHDGRTSLSDGPFAEAKEHLAGFYLVDCVSEERAYDIAGRIPEAAFGVVEVRPTLDLSAFG